MSLHLRVFLGKHASKESSCKEAAINCWHCEVWFWSDWSPLRSLFNCKLWVADRAVQGESAFPPKNTALQCSDLEKQVSHLIKGVVLGISAMQTQAGLEEVRPQGAGKVGWGRGKELAYDPKPPGAMCPCQGSPGVHLMSASTCKN